MQNAKLNMQNEPSVIVGPPLQFAFFSCGGSRAACIRGRILHGRVLCCDQFLECFRLVMRNQGSSDFIQIAFHDAIQLIEREIDAVVG